MKILEFFEDNSGGLSSSRLIMILAVFLVFGAWSYTSIKSGILQPIPESVITLTISIVGLKTVQRFGEKADVSTSSLTTTNTSNTSTKTII